MRFFKKISGLLLIFIIFVNCSQKEKERSEIISRHQNGQKKLLCQYKGCGENERLVGRIKYDDKGRIISEENLPENTKKIIYWDEKGNKDGEGIITNGIKNGKFLESRHKNGKKREDVIFVNGKPQKVFFWDDQGEKIGEGLIVNGLKSGKFIEWHANGQKKTETEFKDGEIINEIEWDENNKIVREIKTIGKEKYEYKAYRFSEGGKEIKLDGFYVNDKLKKVRRFDQIKKTLEVDLDDNQQISKILIWYDDGALWKEEECKNGKLHGKKTYYWGDQKIAFQEFRNGAPVGMLVFLNDRNDQPRWEELIVRLKEAFNNELEDIKKTMHFFKKN